MVTSSGLRPTESQTDTWSTPATQYQDELERKAAELRWRDAPDAVLATRWRQKTLYSISGSACMRQGQ